MPRPSRRDDIIQTAIALFSQHGFNGTGVDMIMREAKVSKKTMYSYFRSKEELILASLQHYDGVFRNGFMLAVEKNARNPQAKLLAVFTVAEAWFMQDNFFGCLFINAVGEYSDTHTPVRKISQHFKAQMYEYLLALCNEAGAGDQAPALADALAMLLEGAIVTAQVGNRKNAAATAQQSANILLANYLPKVAA